MDRVNIGQLNLHNDKVATAELDELVTEHSLDVILVQEQYQCHCLRNKMIQLDNKARAGIYVPKSRATVTFISNLSSSHCAVAEISSPSFSLYVVSCYFQFSDPVAPHLHHLRMVLHNLNGRKVIIGADVNASSSLWFGKIRYSDADRRTAIEDFIAEMNLSVHNTPDAPPTYCSPTGESSIDVTLSSVDVRLDRWRVIPDASCSDHRLIVYEFNQQLRQDPLQKSFSFRYKCRNANWDFFGSLFALHLNDFLRNSLSAEESAQVLTDTFTYCADIAIGRGILEHSRRCDWWNNCLSNIRKDFRRARRRCNRARKRSNNVEYNEALIALRAARSRYRAAVQKAKGNLLLKIVNRLETEGPWSPLYHEFKANKRTDLSFISNIKFEHGHTLSVEETAAAFLNTLIPDDNPEIDNDYHQEVRRYVNELPHTSVSDLATDEEFSNIVNSLATNKTSGHDKISNKMIKEASKTAGDLILSVFNQCISEGVFPSIWRKGFIKIIPKNGDKPPDDPKSYRPITLLPTLGKLLERLIVPRLLPGGPYFHENQYGFTAGKSTIDAAITVRKAVTDSNATYVLGIFLDISGAFDNAWWPMLLLKLKMRGCYRNIYSMLCSYFYNGTTMLSLGHHSVSKSLTQGCPQGSVLGPYLWNLGFDDFLSIPLPQGCSLIGYADDGLLLIQANTRAQLERTANESLSLIIEWGTRNRLEFAPQKTYQLLLKGDLKVYPRIKINGINVKHKNSVCYLGFILERNFSFAEHIRQVGDKAKKNFYAMTRISTSTWGLTFRTLKIIYGATYLGCMCYGSPLWADRATIGAARRKLLQSQRLALIFLCKAYRTVSTEALPVLAGVLPVDLEIQRRASMYFSSRPDINSQFLPTRDRTKIDRLFGTNVEVNDLLLSEWQLRWDTSLKGRHLYQFFPSVRSRISKRWLEVDHCVSQFLTGHGNFKSKLFSFKLVSTPFCDCSMNDIKYEQTAHHILWECDLWKHERMTMLNSLTCKSGTIYYMDLVETRENFRAFKRFCHEYYWKALDK